MEQGVIQVLNKILALGETISGKNGIGLTKKPFIEMELSPESVRLQMEIKRLFDPNLILNPGENIQLVQKSNSGLIPSAMAKKRGD